MISSASSASVDHVLWASSATYTFKPRSSPDRQVFETQNSLCNPQAMIVSTPFSSRRVRSSVSSNALDARF